MKRVIKQTTIPANSNVTNGFETVDYHDTYQIRKVTDQSAEEISKDFMRLPDWANVLFLIRNRIVGIFGLKTDKEMSKPDTFFTLIENRDEEIVMGEDDKHLNFRASIIKDKLENTISIITIVHFNNIWGRVYFFPVKPFHKIIMKAMLKRYLKSK